MKKAEADYRALTVLRRQKPPVHDVVCFHAQQSAEKYLKGLLEEVGLSVPKIHDLDLVLPALLPYYPSLRTVRRGMAFLSTFAVGTRYPGQNASGRQAKAAARWAAKVRATVRALLGISPPRPRGKKSP